MTELSDVFKCGECGHVSVWHPCPECGYDVWADADDLFEMIDTPEWDEAFKYLAEN